MRSLRPVLVALVPFLAVPLCPASDPANKASRSPAQRDWSRDLGGKWVVMRTQDGRGRGDPHGANRLTWVFQGKDLVITEVNVPGTDLDFTLDPSRSPMWIDMLNRETKTPVRGIYSVQGDHLLVCWSLGDRPADFTVRPGVVLTTLERAR